MLQYYVANIKWEIRTDVILHHMFFDININHVKSYGFVLQ